MRFAAVIALLLGASAAQAADRATLIQCQRDLGYGAAPLKIHTDYNSYAKGVDYDIRVVPHGLITAAAAAEINACAAVGGYTRAAPVPVPVATVAVPAPSVLCPPDAPTLYRGTLYCPKR